MKACNQIFVTWSSTLPLNALVVYNTFLPNVTSLDELFLPASHPQQNIVYITVWLIRPSTTIFLPTFPFLLGETLDCSSDYNSHTLEKKLIACHMPNLNEPLQYNSKQKAMTQDALLLRRPWQNYQQPEPCFHSFNQHANSLTILTNRRSVHKPP